MTITSERSLTAPRLQEFHCSLPRSWGGTKKHVATILYLLAAADDGSGITASFVEICQLAGEARATTHRAIQFLARGGFLVDDGTTRGTGKYWTKRRKLMLDRIVAARQEELATPAPHHRITRVSRPVREDAL